MIDALLARASTRFVFVVGKGGVGKTTTAGTLALAIADQGIATHLISTDPAHSIRDLFRSENCSPHLTLEEFNAREYADRFFGRMRAPLIDLIERGTYLDSKDAASFLELSIPGIDEVMSALRLSELDAAASGRVVVDTAPTGHTLRLLDSGKTIESWVRAGRAMAEKAGVVAAAMVGRPVKLEAERVLDEWHASVERFERDVLPNASVIVVTRAGNVVSAETTRLLAELQQRKMKIAAIVSVAGSAPDADFVIDETAGIQGCENIRGLRSHIRNPQNASARAPRGRRADRHTGSAAAWLQSRNDKLIWLAGKGGVGKSTCASAIAVLLSETRRVCLVSTDPAGSLTEILGVSVGAAATPVPSDAPRAALYARQIDAVTEFNRMRSEYESAVDEVFKTLGLESSAALDRRVVESLWDFAPPGIDEIISLLEILDQAGKYDTLVIDSAPTGHFLRLLQMPQLALDWVHALLRLLLKYSAVASLDALAQQMLGFAKRLRQLKLDLSTPGSTAVFIVTLAQAMVEAETARLSSALDQAGVPLAATILNRADDGEGGSRHRLIRAPDQPREIVGPAMLRSFIAQWSLGEEAV